MARFAKLTPEQRKIYLDLSVKYLVAATDRYAAQQREVRETAARRGIEFWTPTPDFEKALAKFRETDLPNVVSAFKARGAPNAQEVVDIHLANLKKWNAFIAQKGHSEEVLVKAINDQIYSRIEF